MAQKQFRKRNAILTYLQSTHSHPNAETVFDALKGDIPDLSLGTVYRNLTYFKEQGLINSMGTVNGVERFDGNTAPHVHFICTQCAAVEDLEEMKVPAQLCQKVEKNTGSQVENCTLTFTGICKNCRTIN